MVKNTIGGKKGKMLANKRSGSSSGGDKKLRLSMNENEIYVCVSSVYGGGMFKVIDNENNEYRANLRGKMKGPNKRHNFVSLYSFLLVGIRSDLSDSSICDVLFVYDDHDILSLSLLPSLNISNLLQFHNNHSISQNVDDKKNDLFTYNDSIEPSLNIENSNVEQFNIDDIDIDMSMI
jgi:hypothetical protein